MKLPGNVTASALPAKPDDLRPALDDFIRLASSHARHEQTKYAKMDARNLSLVVAPVPGRNLTWHEVRTAAERLPLCYSTHRIPYDRTALARVFDPPHQIAYTVLIVDYFDVSSRDQALASVDTDPSDLGELDAAPGAGRGLKAPVAEVGYWHYSFQLMGLPVSMAYYYTAAAAPYFDMEILLNRALSQLRAAPADRHFDAYILKGRGVYLAIEVMGELTRTNLYDIVWGVHELILEESWLRDRPLRAGDILRPVHSINAAVTTADGTVVAKLAVIAGRSTSLLAHFWVTTWMRRLVQRCTTGCLVPRNEL
ncbi:MAG: hypothetical protein M1832_005796 [Thelocarpon impressellum]|nr:MAG: hypothetical protein M1832_005796 [Thelocarpon impressellum]